MKPILTTLLFLVLIAAGTACKKDADKPCPVYDWAPPVLIINLEDASGHDLLNGPYKKYDTSQVKISLTYQGQKSNANYRCDSLVEAKTNGNLLMYIAPEGTYYVEVQGEATRTVTFTFDTFSDRCHTSYSLKDVFVNGVNTPLRDKVLPLVY